MAVSPVTNITAARRAAEARADEARAVAQAQAEASEAAAQAASQRREAASATNAISGIVDQRA